MKRIILLISLLLLVVGCSQKDAINFEGTSTIVIEKRSVGGLSEDYDIVKTIEDKETVQEIVRLFEKVKWQTNVEFEMVRLADYKLNDNYHMWITPQGDGLEIINQENSNYARLSKSESKELFKITTGKELSSDEIIK